MKICYFVALLHLITVCYAATAGKRFNLVFLENTVGYPDDIPLEVFVSNTGNESAFVNVSSPEQYDCLYVNKTVPARSSVMFDVCWWLRLVATDYWPSYKTVLVESDRDVMVYAYNKELFSADGYYAIPTSQLGYSYVLAAFGAANLATQFAISATTDATSVQISLPNTDSVPVRINYKGLVYTNGETFTLSLNKLETYLGQSRGDLTGTRVLSNAPIAVFSGHVRNNDNSDSRDHMVAQLHPTDDWGNHYILSPVPRVSNFGDTVRVIATRSNTWFTISCSSGAFWSEQIPSAGLYYSFELNETCAITADDCDMPIQVVQMVKSQIAPKSADVADPTMFLLVAQSQWLNDYIAPSLTYAGDGQPYVKNLAFLAIVDGDEDGLRIDGNSFDANWMVVEGETCAWVDVGAGSHIYTHASYQNFTVVVYGASDRESYGFALGADLRNSGCREALMTRGDGLDNDCDGTVDEEECNGVDDDNDGVVDEDCRKSSVDAVGMEYLLMFMENNVDDNRNAKSFLEIYISAADSTETVLYTLQHEGGSMDGSVAPGEVDIFSNLSVDLRHVGSGISNKAIRVNATADIVVYGINKQTWSTDGFLAFPTDVVGTEYYSAHYFPGFDLNEFAFTPVYDDGTPTLVQVTMPYYRDENQKVANCTAAFGTKRIAAGESINVFLNYGETAQFQSASINDNLNGAHIDANKPISVFSGNIRAKVEPDEAKSRDHLVQQLAPVSTWGKEFMTIPIPRSDDRGDIFHITAAAGNTILQINIKSQSRQISQRIETLTNPGNYLRLDLGGDEYAHITSNQPVQVFQYVKTIARKGADMADPAMLMIPPVEQWSRNYRFITPLSGQTDDVNGGFLPFESSVMIAINSSHRDGLLQDGVPLSPFVSWIDLDGTDYSVTISNVSGLENKGHSLTHADPDVYFQALLYGRADRESYALPIGMRLALRECVPTMSVEGDGLDNDCDGSVDEELCNSIDDDADGDVDEDCGSGLSSGTTFYLTYMENTVEYYQGFDLELYVAVVGNHKAIVNVRTPLFTYPSYDIDKEVLPGHVQSYGLTSWMRNEGQGIFLNTIYVRANADIVVYGVNKEKYSNDAFLVYPENSLGTLYYTCHWSPSTLPTEFAVVATFDNTQVEITLPNNRDNIEVQANGRTYGSGDNFTITLQRFQTYQGQSAGDLTGTKIETNVRVAVFAGNVRTSIELSGSRDHLVEQMLQISSYGTEYSVVPFPNRTVGDVLRIISSSQNTTVRVNGEMMAVIAEAGDFFQYQLDSASSVTLTATKPVMVVQFVKSQVGRNNLEEADPAMFVVPSYTNFIKTATFITPVYSGGRDPDADYINYITLVMETGQQGSIRFNGGALEGVSWSSVPSSNHVTTTFTVSSGSAHTITTTSSASFYGRLYGRADRESYAFPIGFSF